jgi:hypothetical protein
MALGVPRSHHECPPGAGHPHPRAHAADMVDEHLVQAVALERDGVFRMQVLARIGGAAEISEPLLSDGKRYSQAVWRDLKAF